MPLPVDKGQHWARCICGNVPHCDSYPNATNPSPKPKPNPRPNPNPNLKRVQE